MNNKLSFQRKHLYYFIIFLFVFIALFYISAFREIGADRDSVNYNRTINNFIKNNQKINYLSKEPTFWGISYISNLFFSNTTLGVFIIYSLIALILKLYSMYKLSLAPFLSIIVYIGLYFILHEMTQIRAGVASVLFLLSIPDIYNRNLSNFIIKSFLAILFHYSAFVMIPFYLIKKNNLYKDKFYYLLLPIIGLLVHFISKEIYSPLFIKAINYLPDFLNHKLNIYINRSNQFNNINLFNIYYTSLFIIYYISLFNLEKLKSNFDFIYVKILGWMLFIFYSFSFFPIIAFRISEFLGIILIILIPNLVFIFKNKRLIYLSVLFYSMGLLYNYLFVQKLIT